MLPALGPRCKQERAIHQARIFVYGKAADGAMNEETTMTTEWMLDEEAHAGPEHLDPDYVRTYDRKAQYNPSLDIQELQRLGLNQNATLIDFGAGSGTFTRAVAPLCRHVIAVDPSPAMIAHLRQTTAGINNLTIVQAGFLSYQHTGSAVDFIFTRNALHHLPDFWKVLALRQLHALLAPQGILCIREILFDFEPNETESKLAEWMAGAVEDSSRGWTASELAEHVRTEHSTFRWLFEVMLQRTNFEILDSAYHRHAYATYNCRAINV
jgi:SAM-dependent methyltransferase